MKQAIPYYRVSTKRQGESGLGLEAQQKSISRFAQEQGYLLLTAYTDIETGSADSRPMLEAALRLCRKKKATLLIAALDRLSRRVSFIANLMESNVEFVVIDDPWADEFKLHMNAAYAQRELKENRKRTKAALAAAKARGVQLGRYGKEVLSQLNREKAYLFACAMQPLIEKLEKNGFVTVRAITGELNKRKVPTFQNKGKKWHVRTVHSLIHKIKESSNMEKEIRKPSTRINP